MSFPPGTEMFQFPGFASLDLCIQPEDTWFTPLSGPPPHNPRTLVPKARSGGTHKNVSGGLPHSEISGSKPIPGSPKLIAGYHVLHRLLLPRHPPNALLALDPIQRRTGHNPTAHHAPSGKTGLLHVRSASPPRAVRLQGPGRKSYILPPPCRVRHRDTWLVYLTWNKTAPGTARPRTGPRHPRPRPHSGEPAVLMFLSLHDCQTCRPTGRRNAQRR